MEVKKRGKVYYPVYEEINCSVRVINKETGYVLNWNKQEQVFYCWILNEYENFVRSGNGIVYHNLDTMALRCATTKKTIHGYVKRLCEVGLLVKSKVKKGFIESSSYEVMDVFEYPFVMENNIPETDIGMMKLLGKYDSDSDGANKQFKSHYSDKAGQDSYYQCSTKGQYFEEFEEFDDLPF